MSEKSKLEKQSSPRISYAEEPGARHVPLEESDVRVIDMKLGEIFLGITGCVTLAAVAFTYYSHVKAKTEERRINAVANAIAAVSGDITKALYGSGIKLGQSSTDVPVKVTRNKKTSRKVAAEA